MKKKIWEFILNLNFVKKIILKITCAFFLAVICGVSYAAESEVYLSLSNNDGGKSRIGLADFVPVNASMEEMGMSRDIKVVLENDLILSRYFNIAPANTSYKFDTDSQFSFWEDKNISVLILGEVSITDLTKLTVVAKLYDFQTKEFIWSKKYAGNLNSYRYIAHQIHDEIIKNIVGEDGVACSKIAFINNTTKFKEVYVIDYDGYNPRRLTKDNSINILPKWVPDKNSVIYTSYLYGNPDLFMIDLNTSRRKTISTIQGLNSPTAFSPDGKTMVATLSRGEFPNLYLLSSDGIVVRRLTQGKYIDTSPCFSPSGREITFISDRAGYPQIYIMDIDGVNLRRIATKGNCDNPVWSPKGDKIAFTMKLDNNFDIFLYDLPRSQVIRLTDKQGDNENPTWSQDGRFIAFSSTRSGKTEIYIIGLDGYTRKLVDMPGSSFTPSWSSGL